MWAASEMHPDSLGQKAENPAAPSFSPEGGADDQPKFVHLLLLSFPTHILTHGTGRARRLFHAVHTLSTRISLGGTRDNAASTMALDEIPIVRANSACKSTLFQVMSRERMQPRNRNTPRTHVHTCFVTSECDLTGKMPRGDGSLAEGSCGPDRPATGRTAPLRPSPPPGPSY